MIREGLTFDDVMMVPQHSDVESRSTDVDISVRLGGVQFSHPVIPANMQTVTGKEMAIEVIKSGGLAILHRFMDEKEQLLIANKLFDDYGNENLAMSVGVKANDKEMVIKFRHAGVRTICIDIAHGDSKHCMEMTTWIKEKWPDMFVISGNVATGVGAERLWRAGADAVKVGIGPGSLCTTRLETGNGVPQLTALMDVAGRREYIKNSIAYVATGPTHDKGYPVKIDRPLYIISDGGIKHPGDVVKALAFSEMVMIGNLFAGCEESPGKRLVIDGVTYKEYVGSSTHKTSHVEGVAALVPAKGSYKATLNKILEGLRSGCSYQGCHTLPELQESPEFIRITNAGLQESHPHDVLVR